MNSADKSFVFFISFVVLAVIISGIRDSIETIQEKEHELKMAEIGYDQIYDKESGKVLWQKSGVKTAQDENRNP